MKLVMSLLILAANLFFQTSVTIRVDAAGAFRVSGWAGAAQSTSSQWPQVFTIQVDEDGVPPLLGSYSLDGGDLVFVPEYPLQPGLSYRAVLKLPGRDVIQQRVTIPRGETTPTTFVEHVYPSTSVLPENQLKFYIHFSAPMSRGEAYKRTRLIDESGKTVPYPFLELTEELWDQNHQRLTLLFDPGRIKRGLVPHNELGTPIEEGKRYTLVIDPQWPDAENKPLKGEFRKTFAVGPADRKPLDPSSWHVVAPKAGTSQPVTVDFSEPLDHALLDRELEVIDASGNRVLGEVKIEHEETRWQLTPNTSWKPGEYSIRLGTILSDLAGNMVDQPFEIDLLERNDQKAERQTRDLAFEVK